MSHFPHPVEVTVFGRPGCAQCKATTKYLTKHGVPHTYRDVADDSTAATLVQILGYQALPVVTVGDVHWSGFRYEKLSRLADIHATAPDISGLDVPAGQYLTGGAA